MCKDFKIKNSGEYHDLYLRSDVLLSSNVFENFWEMCIRIYELDPVKFILVPGLAWQAVLKNRFEIRSINRYRYAVND